jgi:hypothetical protein
MTLHRLLTSIILFCAVLVTSCKTVSPFANERPVANDQPIFWNELEKLCGQSFTGTVVSAPANDTVFKNKVLLMHVRSCNSVQIRVPFFVGEDRSRTWVVSRFKNTLQLKHDHRHRDGSEDSITQYGGRTTNTGSATVQIFPADQHTVNILTAAAGNVWWIELVPGKHFIYNLRRMGTDRLFSIRFDLTKPVDTPEAPWGWKD